jgi:hypothetical protein
MKQKLHKITSIFLALIVLFSSFSYTVNKHVCGDRVIDTTLFVSPDSCGMEMGVCDNKTQFSKNELSISEEDCCQNISVLVKGNDTNQQAQDYTPSLQQIEFVAVFVYSFILKTQNTTELFSFTLYKSPPVFIDIQSFFQIFRI